MYNSLKESGYYLFNQDDPFYNDICSTYTTENGTDIILNDRKEIIYINNGNISLCQTGCEKESYNSTTKKAKCLCPTQNNEIKAELSDSEDKFKVSKIAESFVDTLTYSNFLVLKCYKLVLNVKNIEKNIGRIFMTVIVFLSLVSLVFFCLFDFKKIIRYISIIFDFRMENGKNNKKLDNSFNNKNENRIPKVGAKKKDNKIIPRKKSSKNAIIVHKKEEKTLKINQKEKNKNCLTIKIDKNTNNINKKNKFSKKEPPKKKKINILKFKREKIDLYSGKNSEYNPTSKAFLHESNNNKNKKNIGENNHIININNLQIKNIGQGIKISTNQSKKNVNFFNKKKN